MAGRNTIFYYQWQNRYNKRFYRLEMIPADVDSDNALVALSSPDYVQLPQDSVLREGLEGEVAFSDGLPIGLPTAARLNLSMMVDRLTGSTDITNFRDYLLQPKSQYEYIDDRGFAYSTYNVWTIFDAGTDGTGSAVMFQGVQSAPPTKGHHVSRQTGNHTHTIELRQVQDAVLREVTPAMVCDHLLDVGTASYPSPHNTANHPIGAKNVYELIYRDDVTTTAYGMCDTTYSTDKPRGGDSEPDLDLARLWRLVDLYMGIQNRANAVYHTFIRRSTASTWRFRLITDSADPTDYGGMPYDNLRLYKQSYAATGERGDLLSRSDICFIGQIWNESDTEPGTTGVSETDYADYLGGFLISNQGGNNRDSFYQWETAFDFLTETAELCFSKGGYSITYSDDATRTDYVVNVHFLRLFDAVQGSNPEFALSELLADNGNGEIDLSEGAEVVRKALVEVAGFGSGDRDDLKYSESKTVNESGWTVTAKLHNVPIVNQPIEDYSSRFWLYNGSTNWPTVRGDFKHNRHVIFARPGFRQSLLYYYEAPAIDEATGNKIPLLLHPQVGIHDGLNVYYDGGIVDDWPVSGNQWKDSVTGKDRNILLPVLGRLLTLQGSSGLPFSTARRIVRTFGGTTQNEQTGLSVDISRIGFSHIGTPVTLAASATANAYLPDSTYLAHLNSGGFLTRINLSFNTSKAALTMLAIGTDRPLS